MRAKIITIAVILPILLAIGIASMLYTQSLSDDYAAAVRDIENQARAGDLAGAQQTLTGIATQWEAREQLLQLWIRHADTDEVTMRFKLLQVGLLVGEEPVILEQSALLIEALEHLHHRDDLTLSNIL